MHPLHETFDLNYAQAPSLPNVPHSPAFWSAAGRPADGRQEEEAAGGGEVIKRREIAYLVKSWCIMTAMKSQDKKDG